jgi:hypothetical protein
MNKEKFYDTAYWQGGEGQLLWNLRKLHVFIAAITNPAAPEPFITVIMKSDEDKGPGNWEGWIAEWGSVTSDYGTLNIEYTGKDFSVYAFDKDLNFAFYHSLVPELNPKEKEDKILTQETLRDALHDAKEWLKNCPKTYSNEEMEQRVFSEFNLT